jgi:hypothetical protein
MASYYDMNQMMAYIKQQAMARGINPMKAIEVFGYEGLKPGVWQSNVKQPYGREQSYGPAQLHVAPEGRKPGLGNAFIAKTGLNPADPKNVYKTVDYALDVVAQDGWKQWYGARDHGISRWDGVSKSAKPLGFMQASYSPEGRAPQGLMAATQNGIQPPAFDPSQGPQAQGPPSPPQVLPANAGPPKPPINPAFERMMANSQMNAGGLPQGRPMANPADMMKLKTSLMAMLQPKPSPTMNLGGPGAASGGIGKPGGLLSMLSGLFG